MKKPRLLSLAAIGIVALATMAGCTAPTAGTSPTPSAPASGTPSPTPTPTPVAERLTVDSQSITLLADDGSILQSFTYFEPVDGVLSAFTALFAAEPVVENIEPYEGYPYTRYEWPGVSLNDSAQETDGVYYVNFRIEITTATLNGIALETVEGIAVGDDPLPLEAAHPDDVSYFTPPNTGVERFSILMDPLALPDFVDEWGTSEASFFVAVSGLVGGTVESIHTPLGGGPGI